DFIPNLRNHQPLRPFWRKLAHIILPEAAAVPWVSRGLVGDLIRSLNQAGEPIMPEAQYRHLTSRTESGILILTVTERALDADELTPALVEELRQALAAVEGTPRFVLDLQQVKFLASMGISALLNFRRQVRQRGGRPLLCSLDPLVADVLFTTKLA